MSENLLIVGRMTDDEYRFGRPLCKTQPQLWDALREIADAFDCDEWWPDASFVDAHFEEYYPGEIVL